MTDDTLNAFRHRIDELDDQLMRLLAERFEITKAVGAYKAEAGLPAADPAREARQVARLRDVAEEVGMDPTFSEKVFRLIVDEVIRHHLHLADSVGPPSSDHLDKSGTTTGRPSSGIPVTKLGLSVDELLTTTRAVRKRLDFDKPVEPEVVKECLEAAVQSPTGSNRQGWQWMVVTDANKRAALADLYRQGWAIYLEMSGDTAPGDRLAPDRQAQQARVVGSARYLAENFEKVPVMMIPLWPGRIDGLSAMASVSALGSILPGVWSFMLAARERGLGTAWTTIHLMFEQEAAEILGIDYDKYTQCALVTCGYTLGTDFRPASRPPIETVLHWDGWNGSAPWQ